MSPRRWIGLLLVAGIASCSRRPARSARDVPAGDAVWFEDGPGADDDLEPLLARGGFTAVFVPAARIAPDGDRWTVSEPPPPAHPISRAAVFLVIGCPGCAQRPLPALARVAPLSDALWLAAKAALRDAPRFGRLQGLHLDLPFTSGDGEAYGRAISDLRSRIPVSLPLTVSLRFRPSDAEREKLSPVVSAADGFLAMVFGPGNGADPAFTDRLGKPWWAGYAPGARGEWFGPDGEDRGALPEDVLARLTDDPRVEFAYDLALKEGSEPGFVLRPRTATAFGSWSFPAGSRIVFRQPSMPDLIYRLGGDLAGRRFVRGRVLALTGSSESERIVGLGAIDQILSGGALAPDLRVTVETEKDAVRIGAENGSPQPSVVSRTANWVEMELPNAGMTDVQTGGFDRYEVFGGNGAPVALSRAIRIRFYETLVSPFEKIAPARIAIRKPPQDCCVTRVHLLAASGKEVLK